LEIARVSAHLGAAKSSMGWPCLGASAGAISNSSLVSNRELHGLRASFEIDPKDADLIELRCESCVATHRLLKPGCIDGPPANARRCLRRR